MKNDEPIRIAQIIGKWLGGGVESVVMNYYRNIDRNKIQFDFICDEDSTDIPYEEIEALGGRIILIPPYQKVFKYHKELKRVLKEGNYKIVHSHINTLSVFSLCAAKSAKVPVRIAHNHATSNKKEWKRNLIKYILKHFSKVFATDYFSCSILAGKWLFGKNIIHNSKFYLMYNAIDIDKFKFNNEIRKKLRKKYRIQENIFVIGQIGRFVPTKNQMFTIELFKKYHDIDNDSKLIFVGQGPDLAKIIEKCKSLDIIDNVLFLGQKNNINEIYQMLDVLILPSLYEGLGMVLIEAQCSNLNCICSKFVSSEAKLIPQVNYLGLDESLSKWCESLKFAKKNNNRKDNGNVLCDYNYNIYNEAKKLEKEYFELIESRI